MGARSSEQQTAAPCEFSLNLSPAVSRRERWVIPLLLLPLALLVVNLQEATTGGAYSKTFENYLWGRIGPIFDTRVLMRWILAVTWTFWPIETTPESIYPFLQWGALWVALCATFGFARTFLPSCGALLATLLTALWVTWGFLPIGYSMSYPYDLPALMFSALGLYAITRGEIWLLMAILGLGTLNKETTLWLIPAWALWQWWVIRAAQGKWKSSEAGEPRRLRVLTRKQLIASTLGLCGLYFLLYEVPRFIYRMRAPRETRFMPTLYFADWYEGASGLPRYVVNWRELWHLPRPIHHTNLLQNFQWYALPYLLGLAGWRCLPTPLKLLGVAALAHFIPTFLVGNLWELRIFNEILPWGATCAVMVAHSLLRPECQPAPVARLPEEETADPPKPSPTQEELK